MSDLDEFLAGMYEILKRHERTLFDVKVQTEALRSILTTGRDSQKFELAQEKALLAASEAHESQLRLYDEIIARLRST